MAGHALARGGWKLGIIMAVYEIVRVLDQRSLIDAEACERTYATRAGEGLTPGYYVVIWPAGTRTPTFDASAEYLGPFPAALHAKLKLAQYLETFAVQRAAAGKNAQRFDATY